MSLQGRACVPGMRLIRDVRALKEPGKESSRRRGQWLEIPRWERSRLGAGWQPADQGDRSGRAHLGSWGLGGQGERCGLHPHLKPLLPEPEARVPGGRAGGVESS